MLHNKSFIRDFGVELLMTNTTFIECAVPENIHTPPTEGFLFCTLPLQEFPKF